MKSSIISANIPDQGFINVGLNSPRFEIDCIESSAGKYQKPILRV